MTADGPGDSLDAGAVLGRDISKACRSILGAPKHNPDPNGRIGVSGTGLSR